MSKIFFVLGKSCSGKDTIFQSLKENKQLNLKTVVGYTTRPMRVNEKDGVEYFFVDQNKLEELKKAKKVIECRDYNTVYGIWSYFTVDDGQIDLNNGDYLYIGTLESYEQMIDFYGEDEKYRTLYMHNEAAGEQLVASLVLPSAFYSEPDAVPYEETESSDDYSNGRMTIFRSYLEQLNVDGHDTMGAVLPDGEIAVHAHDIYLQVAFDHGMGVGILFLLFGAATLLRAVFYYRKNKAKPYAAFPLLMTISFAVAGTVEWIFHLSNPCTLVLMMVIAPLLYKDNAKVEE